jgi:hypothetical protein
MKLEQSEDQIRTKGSELGQHLYAHKEQRKNKWNVGLQKLSWAKGCLIFAPSCLILERSIQAAFVAASNREGSES